MINIRSCISGISILQKLLKSDLQGVICHKACYPTSRLLHDGIHGNRGISENVENDLRSRDKISPEFRLIYRAPLVTYVKFTYGFTFVSASVLIPFTGTTIINQGIGTYPILFGDVEVINSAVELIALIGVAALVFFQVYYTVFKYAFRIYHNSLTEEYIAIYQHILPGKVDKEHFQAGEMKKVINSYSIWQHCLYSVNNRKTILLEEYFPLPKDMNDMVLGKENSEKH